MPRYLGIIPLVPYDKYSFTPEINIYDNKIMIASWREKLGIIIESDEIADAMKKSMNWLGKEQKCIQRQKKKFLVVISRDFCYITSVRMPWFIDFGRRTSPLLFN